MDVVLRAIRFVEERDGDALAALYDPEIEFGWPLGLPYGGWHRGADVESMSVRFASLWEPLQPTETERRMDPVVVAASEGTVVIDYQWRAQDGRGRRFSTPTLARYDVRAGRLRRAQMFHFDVPGMLALLREAPTSWGETDR